MLSPDEKKLAEDVLWGVKSATRWHKVVFSSTCERERESVHETCRVFALSEVGARHYENGREYIDGSQQSGHERE